MILDSIHSPTLLVNEQQCHANIERMVDKARRLGLKLKPHFKTHQSAEIGSWFRKFDIGSITVSSVSMANYFADQGWQDITIAFPVNIREIETINHLAERIQQLSLLLCDFKSAKILDNQLAQKISVYIEIDTGANRSGLLPDQTEGISRLLTLIGESENLVFKGFYSHPGHSYTARSKEQIKRIHSDVLDKISVLKDTFPKAKVCIGDTPSCSIADNFKAVDEISPGNFVFYDLMQVRIGSCKVDDIAVTMAAPIVAKYPNRGELILHCGAVHLSKETIEWEGKTIYGIPVSLSYGKWPHPIEGSYICDLSQEHGILKCNEKLLHSIDVGDIIGILPVHSCLAANLMGSYYPLQSRQRIS